MERAFQVVSEMGKDNGSEGAQPAGEAEGEGEGEGEGGARGAQQPVQARAHHPTRSLNCLPHPDPWEPHHWGETLDCNLKKKKRRNSESE